MNPELPPPFQDLPPLPPVPQSPPPKKPHFGWMLFLGVVLNIVSFLLCFVFQNPATFYLGAFIAFVTVFFDRYRGVFIGFIITIGVALLAALIFCGALIVGHK